MSDREAHVSELWNPSRHRLCSRATELSQCRPMDRTPTHRQASPALLERDDHARYQVREQSCRSPIRREVWRAGSSRVCGQQLRRQPRGQEVDHRVLFLPWWSNRHLVQQKTAYSFNIHLRGRVRGREPRSKGRGMDSTIPE